MGAEERYAEPLAYEPGHLVRDLTEPIRVGSMLWVFTDPHPGHEFAYNRWYERDHYYAGCMIGASTLAGSRWVATRRHKDARLPAVPTMPFGRLDGSYACLYFVLDGHHDEWDAWAAPQMHALYAADRGFQGRTHYNTGFWRHEWRAYRDPDPVPVELALDHRYPGMVAVFIDPTPGAAPDELDGVLEATLPAWLRGSPVASVVGWSHVPLSDNKPAFIAVDPAEHDRRLQIHFVEADPMTAWDHYHDLVELIGRSGAGTVALAAPFVATEIGTDRYVDELW
ncbi:MAG: hypothetical protein ACHQNA_07585 [Acidimicrobiales bacterium]